jgi:hypothetical protein
MNISLHTFTSVECIVCPGSGDTADCGIYSSSPSLQLMFNKESFPRSDPIEPVGIHLQGLSMFLFLPASNSRNVSDAIPEYSARVLTVLTF